MFFLRLVQRMIQTSLWYNHSWELCFSFITNWSLRKTVFNQQKILERDKILTHSRATTIHHVFIHMFLHVSIAKSIVNSHMVKHIKIKKSHIYKGIIDRFLCVTRIVFIWYCLRYDTIRFNYCIRNGLPKFIFIYCL